MLCDKYDDESDLLILCHIHHIALIDTQRNGFIWDAARTHMRDYLVYFTTSTSNFTLKLRSSFFQIIKAKPSVLFVMKNGVQCVLIHLIDYASQTRSIP